MKAVASEFPPQGTLFEAYAPVERYARMLESLGDEPPAPSRRIGAEDAFLLHLVGSMYGTARAIVDLAGAATWGASTALWASRDRGRRVLVPDPVAGATGGLAWPDALLEFLDGIGPVAPLEFFPLPASGSFPADLPGLRPGDRRPVLVCLALPTGEGEDPAAMLGPVYDAHPSAVVLLLGLGRVGEDPAVESLSGWARGRGLGLAALRDLSPFLASSRAAAIFPAPDDEFARILGRIGQLFDGNFDFLALARQVCTLSLAREKSDARASQLQSYCGELERSVKEWQDHCGQAREREREAREDLGSHIERLLGELYERNQQIEGRDRLIEGLRLQLERECGRPILKTLALQGGRRALSFGRRHRELIAPGDSRRARTLRTIMRLQRRLRGRAA